LISTDKIGRRFYEYSPDVNSFASVGFAVGEPDEDDNSKVVKLHSTDVAIREHWENLTCHGFNDNPIEIGDFPSVANYSRIPMVSRRAWTVLQPVIGSMCEALPINSPFEGEYFLVHVLRTIDALDETSSEVERRSVTDKRIRRVFGYAFRDNLIEGMHIFKLPNKTGSGLIVDDVFCKTVEDHGLRGLQFHELPMRSGV
jgi:hypothetical protein